MAGMSPLNPRVPVNGMVNFKRKILEAPPKPSEQFGQVSD